MGEKQHLNEDLYTAAAIASTEKNIRALAPYHSITWHDVMQNSAEEITGFSN